MQTKSNAWVDVSFFDATGGGSGTERMALQEVPFWIENKRRDGRVVLVRGINVIQIVNGECRHCGTPDTAGCCS